MKKKGVIFILSLALIILSVSISLAADPSELIVIRASDNSLWKATCSGLTCTNFTLISGQFTSQPAVIWDVNLQRYVLWGRGLDGSVWRSTFNYVGGFNNDWAIAIPGSTANPPGAAGGGLSQNTWFTNPDWTPTELTSTLANLNYNWVWCPWDGIVFATTSGTVDHNRASATGSNFSRIYLSETSGGTATTWAFTDLPSGQPVGHSSFPFSLSKAFSCPTSGGAKYVYVTGEEGGGAAATTTTYAYGTTIFLQYVPYSY